VTQTPHLETCGDTAQQTEPGRTRRFTVPGCSSPDDLTFAFLTLTAHPRGNLILEALLGAGFVPGLVIAEHSPTADKGRDEQLSVLRRIPGFQAPEATEELCARHGIPYLKVANHNSAETRNALRASAVSLAVLGDTRILKQEVIDTVPGGIINIHPGLLPEVRGNNPYIWSVIHGLPQGATAHLINAGVDTGPVLLAEPMALPPGATVPTLVRAVNESCARLAVDCLHRIVAGRAELRDQSENGTLTFRQARPEVWALAEKMLEERRTTAYREAGFEIVPGDAVLGARVAGLDMRKPPTPAVVEAIEDALERFGVLIVPEQNLTPAEQVRFSRAFGELDLPPRFEDRQAANPEIFVIGNPGERTVLFAPDTENDTAEPEDDKLEWHADHSQYAHPTWISMMYGVAVPPKGGDTLFACTYASYEALDEETRGRYDGIQLLHSVRGVNEYLRELGRPEGISEAELELEKEPPQCWPLVRTHPRSGRKALYFGARMSIGAVGMHQEAGRRLIREVTDWASRPEFVYRHTWQAGDAVLWDNRRVVHAATPFDVRTQRRIIHRTTVRDNTEIR
jgi:alpha-ketoglutarate-dependent taurine dioxygenase/folate-dependent phosphoribosylglycinamide formyltransferase PurN